MRIGPFSLEASSIVVVARMLIAIRFPLLQPFSVVTVFSMFRSVGTSGMIHHFSVLLLLELTREAPCLCGPFEDKTVLPFFSWFVSAHVLCCA